MDPDLHRPCPGQTQTRCDLYIDLLRGIIEWQAKLIADYVRREQERRVTHAWLRQIEHDSDPS